MGFVATEAFSDLLKDAKVIRVDPGACIPYVRVRDIIASGVNRIKYSYASNEVDALASGAVAGGLLPTVVLLSGSSLRFVVLYFIEECGMSEEEAKKRVESKEVWYGIVDGTHRLFALLKLQEENPERWAGFTWCVLLITSALMMSTMRAFARAQNMRQRNETFVETTIFDILSGLKSECKRLCAQFGGRDPSPKEISESYSGCHDRTTTSMRHLASIAIRLSARVIAVIGEITNFEDPTLACVIHEGSSDCSLTPDNVGNTFDCRIFRHFLTMSSLRLATAFMSKPRDHYHDEIRVIALHRARELCRLSGFRPVSYKTLNEQFIKAGSAMREAEKFESLLQSSIWPHGMQNVKDNLLRNTVMDKDVEMNEGNDKDILPALLRHLRRCCAQTAPFMEARYIASIQDGIGNGNAGGDGINATNATESKADDSDGKVASKDEVAAKDLGTTVSGEEGCGNPGVEGDPRTAARAVEEEN